MRKKDLRELRNSWIIATEAAILGFFLSIAGNAIYSCLDSGFTWRRLIIAVVAFVASVYIVNLLMFMFENFDLIEDDVGILKVTWEMIKSWRNQNE